MFHDVKKQRRAWRSEIMRTLAGKAVLVSVAKPRIGPRRPFAHRRIEPTSCPRIKLRALGALRPEFGSGF
jgi:hypothetical protein